MRESIGLKDRDGKDIFEGDIVEFWVEYDYLDEPIYDSPTATRMVDTVKIINDVAYFWDEDVQNAAFAWRHNEHCRVIGNIHDAVKVTDISL